MLWVHARSWIHILALPFTHSHPHPKRHPPVCVCGWGLVVSKVFGKVFRCPRTMPTLSSIFIRLHASPHASQPASDGCTVPRFDFFFCHIRESNKMLSIARGTWLVLHSRSWYNFKRLYSRQHHHQVWAESLGKEMGETQKINAKLSPLPFRRGLQLARIMIELAPGTGDTISTVRVLFLGQRKESLRFANELQLGMGFDH